MKISLLSKAFLIILLIIPTISFADADKIFSDSSDSLGRKGNSKAVVVVVTLNEKGEPISQGMT